MNSVTIDLLVTDAVRAFSDAGYTERSVKAKQYTWNSILRLHRESGHDHYDQATVAAVDHHVVPDVNADKRCAAGIVGPLEKDQVARLCLGTRDDGTDISQAFRRQSSIIPSISAVVDDPADKA